MSGLISIVLPVYNGERFLQESIESVLAQTYTNWELLILDDCSTDSTPQIAIEYSKKDARIKYFRNEKNLRLPGNLNRGFSLAQGDYLTWTSDDNRYHSKALEVMLSTLTNSKDVQFVFASMSIVDSRDNEIERYIVSKTDVKRIVGFNVVGACFLFSREVYETVGDYDPEMILVEDYDYWQRVFMKFNVCAIPEILYDYRRHEGALTSTMRQETFQSNLEKMLLKNVKGFGKLNILQRYVYYDALNNCRKKMKTRKNPYLGKYFLYYLLYMVMYRIPEKINQKLH